MKKPIPVFHVEQKYEHGPLCNRMRETGCRMENTRKNVGKSGYAFNALQRLLLPSSLRPTAATTLAGLQS